MHDERDLYRLQWPALRRHLHHLCLDCHGKALLDTLCNCGEQAQGQENRVHGAVDAWQQGILEDLTWKTKAADAWLGWEALLPLFGDTERLYRDIGYMVEEICHEYTHGGTAILWNVLRTYFSKRRDDLDGAKKTRLQVWRKIDQIQHELNAQQRQQRLDDCQPLPELVAHILAVINNRNLKDAPTTVEGVLSYFYEFDAAFTQPYDDEMHSLDAVEALTDSDWQGDLARCLEQLPAALRQAVEIRYGLRPQPAFLSTEARRVYYGCSDRTLRDRATKAVQLLRHCLGL